MNSQTPASSSAFSSLHNIIRLERWRYFAAGYEHEVYTCTVVVQVERKRPCRCHCTAYLVAAHALQFTCFRVECAIRHFLAVFVVEALNVEATVV